MHRWTRRQVLAFGLGSLAGIGGPGSRAYAQEDAPAIRYDHPRRYRITHRGVFRNGDVRLDSLELWLPIPQDSPEQTIESLEVRPRVPIVEDANGLAKVAKYYATKGLPKPGEEFALEVSYQVVVRRVMAEPAAMEPAADAVYTNEALFRLYTRPEKKIETGHPAIVERAAQLRREHRDPVSIARAAYDWVLDHVEYRLIDGFGGAVYCLENTHGECGDYSALLVALCRAAGVPARPVSGFWADQTDGWHCWAEVMLPGGQWIPVDAALGDRNWFNRRYYFGSMDNRRVALCRTNDIDLAGSQGGHRTRDFLQVGAWWWHGHYTTPQKRPPEARFLVTGEQLGAGD